MDANNVLSHYMELTNERSDFFRHNLASNAVLEWFGRTFRGSENIEHFLRFDVWPQYDQQFVVATTCDPIETKPPHEQSKETPIENKITCLPPAPRVTKGFESPPPTRRNLDAPPPLIRPKNRIRPKTDDESGKSSDSDGDEAKTYTRTYNLRRLAGVRDEPNNNKSTKTVRTLRKRIADEAKATETRSVSPMKRTKKASNALTGSSLSKCSSSSTKRHCDNLNPYSELHYLESIGSIRTIRRAKHPFINKVPMARTVATPFVSPESQNGWDRKTKLKISYRIGLLNEDDIQFALIIYEPMTMLIRRNLLEEFQKAAEEEEQRRTVASPKISTLQSTPIDKLNQSDLLKTPLDRVKTKIERPLSLRRLRF